MLASLLQVPRNDNDWRAWSFANSQDLLEIQQAIQAQHGVNLPQYVLDPVTIDALPRWLERNQQALDGINGVLKLQGDDVEIVDLENPRELQGWVYSIFQQHRDARAALKI
jgi:hypothetical protein